MKSAVFSDLPARTIVFLDDAESTFFMVDPSECSSQKIYFDFSTPYGHHFAKIKPDGNSISIEIDDNKLNRPQKAIFDSTEWDAICSRAKKGRATVNLSDKPEIKKSFLALLEDTTPFCKFTFGQQDSIRCELASDSESKSKDKVKQLEKKLFRYRQRHPYVLARKIALTRKLQAAYESPADEKIQELCEIIKLSTPIELPLPMRSLLWQKSVCNHKTTPEQRKRVFAHSLYESHQELDYLLNSFRRTRTGVLTLKIPKDSAPGKDYWVTLKPESLEIKDLSPNSCFWHPLYQDVESKVLFNNLVARNAGVMKSCPEETSSAEARPLLKKLSNYITYNICSEMEFVISNGRGKILALPKGKYSYTLRQHYGLFSKQLKSESIKATTSEGIFSWSRRRPYPTIREF